MKNINYNMVILPLDKGLNNWEIANGMNYLILLEAPLGADVTVRLNDNVADAIPLKENYSIEIGNNSKFFVNASVVAGGILKMAQATTSNEMKIITAPKINKIGVIGTIDKVTTVSKVEDIEVLNRINTLHKIEQIGAESNKITIDKIKKLEKVDDILYLKQLGTVNLIDVLDKVKLIDDIKYIKLLEEIKTIQKVEKIQRIESFSESLLLQLAKYNNNVEKIVRNVSPYTFPRVSHIFTDWNGRTISRLKGYIEVRNGHDKDILSISIDTNKLLGITLYTFDTPAKSTKRFELDMLLDSTEKISLVWNNSLLPLSTTSLVQLNIMQFQKWNFH